MKKPPLGLISRTLNQMKEDLWLQVVAISTLSLCLFIMGTGLIAYLSTNRVLDRVSVGAGLRLVLKPNLGPADSLALRDRLSQWPEVEEASYISQDEALARLGRRLGQEYEDLLSGLSQNPLPAVIELQLKPTTELAELASLLKRQDGIEEIIEARPWLTRLETISHLIRGVIVFLGAILFTALALVAANSMRLAVYARREQLAILDMLGASRFYLRAPFILEALLHAFLAAALSSAIIALCLYFTPIIPEMPLWLGMLLPTTLPPLIPLCLFSMAILAGLAGGWLGVSRALRAPELA